MIKSKGFTIVELLIVIVVIGILAAIVIVAFNGVQSRARDSERATEIKNIQKKLEIYFTEKGYYPNSSQMMNATFRTELGLNSAALTPTGGSALAYCWAADPSRYCYVARRAAPVAGNWDCTGPSTDPNETCVSYTLTYRLEDDPDTRIDIRSP